MLVLDTRVLSEAMKTSPHPPVRAWLNDQVAETLYRSSVALADLLFGLAVLPAGRRKAMLGQTHDGLMRLFKDRGLRFDTDAARCYAESAVKAQVSGQGFPTPDGYIAAIAAARSFIVATRDAASYRATRLTIIDPWEA